MIDKPISILEALIKQSPNLESNRRDRLLKAIVELKQALHTLSESDPDSARAVATDLQEGNITELEDRLLSFNASHPALSSALQVILCDLSSLGI